MISSIKHERKHQKSLLKSIGRSNYSHTPLKNVGLINQTGREPINRVLTKICKREKKKKPIRTSRKTYAKPLASFHQKGKKKRESRKEKRGFLIKPLSCFARRRLAWDAAINEQREKELRQKMRELSERLWRNRERFKADTSIIYRETIPLEPALFATGYASFVLKLAGVYVIL